MSADAALREHVSLARQCPVQFDDACGVADSGVQFNARELCGGIIKACRQPLYNAFDQPTRPNIIGKVNGVEEMAAVAAVGEDRLWPTLWINIGTDSTCLVERSVVSLSS